jgi:hypothetical protein
MGSAHVEDWEGLGVNKRDGRPGAVEEPRGGSMKECWI